MFNMNGSRRSNGGDKRRRRIEAHLRPLCRVFLPHKQLAQKSEIVVACTNVAPIRLRSRNSIYSTLDPVLSDKEAQYCKDDMDKIGVERGVKSPSVLPSQRVILSVKRELAK